jgi:hypothetical protein
MVVALEPMSDCPDCGARDAVWAGLCDLCASDLGERRPPGRRGSAVEPPDEMADLKFSDVVAELRALVDLARAHEDASSIAAAGVRAEWLLGSLRTQFLRDLGLPRLGAAGAE